MTMVEYRKRVLPVINNAPAAIPAAVKVSDNGKTGISINLAIVETCQPTRECMDYCYGTRGPIAFKNSILAQHANVLRFTYLATAPQSEVDAECDAIATAVRKGKQNWIRWNGVGDLIPGSVRVINRMAELHPEITQWVVTRKVNEAATLADKPSIKVLFSLDSSTPDTILQRAKELRKTYKHAAFRFSWTRRDATKVPRHIHIVFNEHTGVHKEAWKDKRVCEATLPDHPHEDACNRCRRCFA